MWRRGYAVRSWCVPKLTIYSTSTDHVETSHQSKDIKDGANLRAFTRQKIVSHIKFGLIGLKFYMQIYQLAFEETSTIGFSNSISLNVHPFS